MAISISSLRQQTLVGDGSSNLPSISFSGDVNTGLYRIGADVIGVVTGGIERMRVDATGNVGIGTSNPQAPLHCVGNIASDATLIGTTLQLNGSRMYHFHVSSTGIGFTSDQQRGVWMNGALVAQAGRSWHILVIGGTSPNKGAILRNVTWDVYGSVGAATSLISDLTTYNTDNNVIILHTYDEPESNADAVRNHLQNNMSAKLANAPKATRYAYAFAYRHSYGVLAEAHSAYMNGSTLTAATRDNNTSRCACQCTVFL